jgi:signal transduction histidine kinase
MGDVGIRRAAERSGTARLYEFIATLSHELRNPLGAIRTSLYILEHDRSGPEAVADARMVIDRQISQLVRLLDDLMDVARIPENGIRLERRRLDVTDLVRAAVDEHRPQFGVGDIGLRARLCPGPLHVQGDGARIKQVLAHLLSNAAKFTPPGGTVTVSAAPDGDGRAVVAVADTGAGIEPSLLPRLFQPFAQGDRIVDRRTGGFGIGLALVKHLVELHGGEVRAESRGPDRGAEFTVRLPLDADAPA